LLILKIKKSKKIHFDIFINEKYFKNTLHHNIKQTLIIHGIGFIHIKKIINKKKFIFKIYLYFINKSRVINHLLTYSSMY
jgi:hypothetical protein